jgi:outer membrane protein OmpA-like peptidoglycan-associated protein
LKPNAIIATATLCVMLTGCISATDPHRKAKQGAAVGAAAGAVAGAVVGNQSGNRNTGAVIGAAVGAGVGGAVGYRMDKQQAELEEVEGIEVERTADDEIAVTIHGDLLYDVDSVALRPGSRATLDDMSGVLANYPDTMILVSGHADSTGSEEHNQELSTRRAQTVSDYLSSQGVAGSRIESRGYGETNPRESNETAEGRQLNRRVEIRIKAESQ